VVVPENEHSELEGDNEGGIDNADTESGMKLMHVRYTVTHNELHRWKSAFTSKRKAEAYAGSQFRQNIC
jgi:hypothetical protein